MRVISIEGTIGAVDASGTKLSVALDLLQEVQPGDYVLVHAGYAISRLTAEEAEESLAILERLTESWQD
jgi:hydrogenase expression/formation protein HypC